MRSKIRELQVHIRQWAGETDRLCRKVGLENATSIRVNRQTT
jgi:hypothetical protein